MQRSRGAVPPPPPQEPASKREASKDQQEQPEKNEGDQEKRGAKRCTDDWGMFAKDLKAGTQRRAEDRRRRSERIWTTTR